MSWRSETSWKLHRARCERLAAHYRPGDIVVDRERGHVGIVTDGGRRVVTVVFWSGERRAGAMLGVGHVRPRRNIAVPKGAMGTRGWNRQQAVTAALRRAGISALGGDQRRRGAGLEMEGLPCGPA